MEVEIIPHVKDEEHKKYVYLKIFIVPSSFFQFHIFRLRFLISIIIWLILPRPILVGTLTLLRAWNYFFSDSHLSPNFSKWWPMQKRWSPFLKTNKTFFSLFVCVLDRPSKIKFYEVDTSMGVMRHSSSPKSKMASNYRSRCMCCVLEIKQT